MNWPVASSTSESLIPPRQFGGSGTTDQTGPGSMNVADARPVPGATTAARVPCHASRCPSRELAIPSIVVSGLTDTCGPVSHPPLSSRMSSTIALPTATCVPWAWLAIAETDRAGIGKRVAAPVVKFQITPSRWPSISTTSASPTGQTSTKGWRVLRNLVSSETCSSPSPVRSASRRSAPAGW